MRRCTSPAVDQLFTLQISLLRAATPSTHIHAGVYTLMNASVLVRLG